MTTSIGFAPTIEENQSRRRNSMASNEKEDAISVTDTRKRKITISLSEKSLRALDELRRATDADTDSEVFRNALRLHLALLRAHASGVQLLMKRPDGQEIVPVTLFAESET
jgi:Ribbon-helix-helix protein, copG family